jgi:peptidoglycan hydrolase-like protein with peptidoglycan-binding domain
MPYKIEQTKNTQVREIVRSLQWFLRRIRPIAVIAAMGVYTRATALAVAIRPAHANTSRAIRSPTMPPLVNAPVGRTATNDPDDVAIVEDALNRTGDLNGEPTGFFGERTEDAVKRVQARHGVEQNGTVTPDDDTDNALRAEAGGNRDPFVDPVPDLPMGPGRASPTTPATNPAPARPNLVEGDTGENSGIGPSASTPPGRDAIGMPPYDRARDRVPDVPNVPDPKTEIVDKYNWHVFHESAAKQHGISERRRKIYGDIFAFEGGAKKHPESSAYGGILEGTLNGLKSQGRLPNVPRDAAPKDLSTDTLPKLYDAYFDDALGPVGGSKALDDLPDERTAAATADTIFRHGPRNGTRAIQRTINRTDPNRLATDGYMGPNTYKAIPDLAKSPETRRSFLKILPQERKRFMGADDQNLNYFNLGGDKTRFRYFEFQNESGN